MTDEQADEIKKAVRGETRGLVLLNWVDQLMADRDERRQKERRAESKRRYCIGQDAERG